MRKKDIQKLNDAMLENVEVSDGVLDMAREQMRAANPEEVSVPAASPAKKQKAARSGAVRGGAIAVNRKAVAVGCACAIAAVIAVVALVWSLNRGTFNSSDGGKSYKIAELTASDITSISDYNAKNGTTYLCFEDVSTSSVLYSEGETCVLFAESFVYGETECTWYVLVNGRDYVDALEDFEQLLSQTEIGGYTVYYNSAEGCQYAELYYGESRCCLLAESQSAQVVFDFFEDILK